MPRRHFSDPERISPCTSVLLAGALLGLMGYFTRSPGELGIPSGGCILLRCGAAALLFGITLLITDPHRFAVKLRGVWCFVGSGIVSLLFFTYCYFEAITRMSLSAAAMLLSAVFFKENVTPVKLAALMLAFAGCCLVSGLGSGGGAVSAPHSSGASTPRSPH